MPFPIAAVIGGSLLSGILGSRASSRAAGATRDANAAAIAEQRRQFDTIFELTRPQRQVGNQALNAIASLLGLEGAEPRPTQPDLAAESDLIRDNPPGSGLMGNAIHQLLRQGGRLGPIRGAEDMVTTGEEPFDAGFALENLPGNDVIVDDMTRRIRQSSPTTGGNVLQSLADRVSGFQSDRLFNSLFQLAGFGPQGTSTAARGAESTGNAVSNLMQSTGISNASGILGSASAQNNSIQNLLQFMMLRGMGGGVNVNPRIPAISLSQMGVGIN